MRFKIGIEGYENDNGNKNESVKIVCKLLPIMTNL